MSKGYRHQILLITAAACKERLSAGSVRFLKQFKFWIPRSKLLKCRENKIFLQSTFCLTFWIKLTIINKLVFNGV